MVLNDLDRIILIIVGIGACIGLYRGFFREAIGIAGIVLAAIAANLASPFTKPFANNFIESDTIASIVVWVIVFFFSMFLLNRLAVLLDHFMDSISLGWINRLLALRLFVLCHHRGAHHLPPGGDYRSRRNREVEAVPRDQQSRAPHPPTHRCHHALGFGAYPETYPRVAQQIIAYE